MISLIVWRRILSLLFLGFICPLEIVVSIKLFTMSKNLVIVESPAKAKTIEGYLGKDFKVASSYGHVRDLPKGDKAIDIQNKFRPTYEVTPDKKG